MQEMYFLIHLKLFQVNSNGLDALTIQNSNRLYKAKIHYWVSLFVNTFIDSGNSQTRLMNAISDNLDESIVIKMISYSDKKHVN